MYPLDGGSVPGIDARSPSSAVNSVSDTWSSPVSACGMQVSAVDPGRHAVTVRPSGRKMAARRGSVAALTTGPTSPTPPSGDTASMGPSVQVSRSEERVTTDAVAAAPEGQAKSASAASVVAVMVAGSGEATCPSSSRSFTRNS